MAKDLDRIRAIKSFPSLIKYLRDDLGWEFETDDVEDLTFDYEPEELGLDAKTAVKIKDIKQLRPLVTNQPWGIFYINFEPKRLPVVVLRRILRSLVLKKRASANRGQQAAWKLNDLLFISSYGDNDERAITFAHFSDNSEVGDLPTLKVLGWDAQDTVLHLEDAHRTLKEKLRFPDDPSDAEAWREQWSSAFTLWHREVVTTSIELAKRLAGLATLIRDRANQVLAIESNKGAFRRLHEAFKEALIHDLSIDDFADMYAQTIAYGLLSARVSRPAGLIADNLVDMVPSTNPFLKELLGTFLKIGGRDTSRANQKANAIDFDELGINEVVELLREANMEAVLRDFGNRNPTEDPVIHFYELFLKEYDPVKRMKRGVFYTPRPVVSFIVRSVDEILRREFELADGLADTATWREMSERHEGLQIPAGVSPDAPFVQILDPATGTGTFLVETIDVIHATLTEKWRAAGKGEREIRELWNDYVPKHLLPRLYGFELMMAPYSIAHMKIGLKLRETGYSFLSSERARIYLTNTLEEPKDFSGYFAQMAPALAHEAAEANTIKRYTPITVVIGNPPYSKNSGNRGEHAESLVQPYKDAVLGERNVQPLSDDYVKFIAWSNLAISERLAVIGMITNRSYLEGVIHRGMRNSLLSSYNKLFVIDLHGDSNIGEAAPDGNFNENVFDITQGVAISILCRSRLAGTSNIHLVDSWGRRNDKYKFLLEHKPASITWNVLTPSAPYYFFVPKDFSLNEEINTSWKVDQIFLISGMGLKTRRDHFLLSIDENDLTSRFKSLVDAIDVESLRKSLAVSDNPQWTLAKMQKLVRREGVKNGIYSIAYRPFDQRVIWYHREAIERGDARYPIMQHVLNGGLSLLVSRLSMNEDFDSVFVADGLSEMKTAESTRGSHCFPLYIKDNEGQLIESNNKSKGRANLAPQFIADFAARLNLRFLPDGRSDLGETFTPEDVFHYIYAVFHSPAYRTRYSEFLKIDFPRVPLTTDRALFRSLCQLGANLVALHLLKDEYAASSWNTSQPKGKSPLKHLITRFAGTGSTEVAKGYPKYENARVYINAARYFEGILEEVWNFHVGGYQVAHKWLKDRRGRTLTDEDLAHYQRVVVALHETNRLMAEIDRIIEKHGGLPLTGSQDAPPTTKDAENALPFD